MWESTLRVLSRGGKNRVSPSQETVAQCAYWRGCGSDCWLAWSGEWNLLAHTKRSRDAWISLAQCRKRNPRKEECWCGYIVYDLLTPIPWPCPMKGTKRYSLHQGIEKYIGEGSATTSLCHHKHCHGYFIYIKSAVRAARIKQLPEASGGTITRRGKVTSEEVMVTTTIPRTSLGITVVCISDTFGRN